MGDFELERLPDDVQQSIADLVASDPAKARSLHQVSRHWRRACQQRAAQLRLRGDQLQLPWHQQALQSFCNVSGLHLRFQVGSWTPSVGEVRPSACLNQRSGASGPLHS